MLNDIEDNRGKIVLLNRLIKITVDFFSFLLNGGECLGKWLFGWLLTQPY